MDEIKEKLRYWLAWHASDWVYQDPASRGDGAEWLLECGDGVEYQATVKQRMASEAMAPLQFSSFDVEVTGGALTVTAPWKIYILAFRGTVTLQDWVTNWAVLINWDSPLADLGVGVHAGWHAYVSDREKQKQLRDALVNIDSDEILLAGHSLGGALAQIAMLFLWREHETGQSPLHNQEHIANHARCVTFGSPAPFAEMPIANPRDRAKRLREQARSWMEDRCVNFVNINDPVPRLPFALDFVAELIPCGRGPLLYKWMLPEGNSLTPQLRQYEHFCSHIMLNRGEVTFQPEEPAAEALLERGPRVSKNEHDLKRYQEHVFPKVLEDVTQNSRQLLQVVRYKPRGGATNVALCTHIFYVRLTLRKLSGEQEANWLQKLHETLHYGRLIATELDKINAEMNATCVQAQEARRLHKQFHDQFTWVESHIQVEQSCENIHGIIENQIFPATKQLRTSVGTLQAFYRERLAQPVKWVRKLTTDLHSFTGNVEVWASIRESALNTALSGALMNLVAKGALICTGSFAAAIIAVMCTDFAAVRFLNSGVSRDYSYCLRVLFSQFREWAEHLIGETKDFEERITGVEQILKDRKAEDTYGEIEDGVNILAAQAWELLTAAKTINHEGVSPEVVEQKKQELRDLGKKMIERAGEIRALMGEEDRPLVPELDLPPLHETTHIWHAR